MKLHTHHSPRGFTLVEMLIAVSIVGILMAVGASSYQTWINNTRVRSVATSISQGIQLARATAIKNNSRASFDFTGTIAGNTTTADWAVCDNTVNANPGNRPCLAADIVEQFAATGKSSQLLVTFTGTSCMEFNGMGRRNTTARCNSNSGQIDITYPAAGTCENAGGKVRCLRITTDSAGTTRMCDPALSQAVNPAGCL